MRTPKNLGASVRQRLLDGARTRGEEFNLILTRFAIERLLFRLGQSPHRDRFVLKGASLYTLWTRESPSLGYRPTRDLDFWGSGSPDVANVVAIFREVMGFNVEDDGLHFEADSLKGQRMRQEALYEGCRLSLVAVLDGVRIPLSVDLGFGDAITPPASEVEYPTLLPVLPAPKIRVYPRETVVAEKFEALVSLDQSNTRMKDFYDLWMLSQNFEFDGATLLEAVKATFERRQTEFPSAVPTALTARYFEDTSKLAAWNGFVKRSRLSDLPPLRNVMEELQGFLEPLGRRARTGENFLARWTPLNHWVMLP